MSTLKMVFFSFSRPLRNEEILPKQSYAFDRKSASLKTTDGQSTTNNKTKKSKTSKKKQRTADSNELIPIGDKVSKKSSNDRANGAPNMDFFGMPDVEVTAEKSNVHKPKKVKNDKQKDRKERKSSKKLSAENDKSGYEEALGISTPSKEIVTN